MSLLFCGFFCWHSRCYCRFRCLSTTVITTWIYTICIFNGCLLSIIGVCIFKRHLLRVIVSCILSIWDVVIISPCINNCWLFAGVASMMVAWLCGCAIAACWWVTFIAAVQCGPWIGSITLAAWWLPGAPVLGDSFCIWPWGWQLQLAQCGVVSTVLYWDSPSGPTSDNIELFKSFSIHSFSTLDSLSLSGWHSS